MPAASRLRRRRSERRPKNVATHDPRFKALLKEFFPEFLQLFFPERAARLDLGRIKWFDKELIANPPEGEVQVLDLVARIRLLQSPEAAPAEVLVIVHMEIESRQAVTDLRPRLHS